MGLSAVCDCGIHHHTHLLLLLTFCLLLLPLWESVIVLCFVVRYFMSILVLQSSWWGRESWLVCLICLPGVSWWLSCSSSQCHGVVCSLWLWYSWSYSLTIFGGGCCFKYLIICLYFLESQYNPKFNSSNTDIFEINCFQQKINKMETKLKYIPTTAYSVYAYLITSPSL